MKERLTADEMRRLKSLVRSQRRDAAPRKTPQPFKPPRVVADIGIVARMIKAPSGGIPARAGNYVGTATCDVYDLDDDLMTLADTGIDIEVVNWTVNTVCDSGARYGWVNYYDNKWWIVAEDCSDTSAALQMTFSGVSIPDVVQTGAAALAINFTGNSWTWTNETAPV